MDIPYVWFALTVLFLLAITSAVMFDTQYRYWLLIFVLLFLVVAV